MFSKRMSLVDFSELCHAVSNEAGWWENLFDLEEEAFLGFMVPTKIALIHTELSEALEGYRKDEDDKHLPHRKSIEVELADALIRIFDLAGALNLNLDAAVFEKMKYNEQRADHKLENRRKLGGKRF